MTQVSRGCLNRSLRPRVRASNGKSQRLFCCSDQHFCPFPLVYHQHSCVFPCTVHTAEAKTRSRAAKLQEHVCSFRLSYALTSSKHTKVVFIYYLFYRRRVKRSLPACKWCNRHWQSLFGELSGAVLCCAVGIYQCHLGGQHSCLSHICCGEEWEC